MNSSFRISLSGFGLVSAFVFGGESCSVGRVGECVAAGCCVVKSVGGNNGEVFGIDGGISEGLRNGDARLLKKEAGLCCKDCN